MIKDILLDKWFYTFIIGWVAFLLLVDWSTLAYNIWGGIAAVVLELWWDATAVKVGMYHMQDMGISLFKVPVFLTFGTIFTMGVLFFQYMPQKPKLQFVHLVAFSIGFIIFEAILKRYGLIVSPHWNLAGSFFDNIIVMGSLVWLKHFVLYKSKAE